jgi:hypothetical protein
MVRVIVSPNYFRLLTTSGFPRIATAVAGQPLATFSNGFSAENSKRIVNVPGADRADDMQTETISQV